LSQTIRVKPPSEELRKAANLMLREHETNLKCMAGVIEANGFMGALTRSVLLGMAALAGRQRVPQAYFPHVQEAASWIARYLTLDAGALTESVTTLRAELRSASIPVHSRRG
jgi:hypothetical protein